MAVTAHRLCPIVIRTSPLTPEASIDETAPDVVGCMRRAFREQREAELKIIGWTVEGDPFREYWRLHEDGRMELSVDSTEDTFSSGSWQHQHCVEPSWLPQVDCQNDSAG